MKINQDYEEMDEEVCKDDLYYERIIVSYLGQRRELKGGEAAYEI